MEQDELLRAREARDTAFSEFMAESAKATRHAIKAKCARHKYMLAAQEVRAIERDLLAFPVN